MSDARRIGKYTIEQPLPKGSWGNAFRGSEGGKTYALKVVQRGALDAETMERLRRDAAALGRVRHPALATFVELLIADKVICAVYELAEGSQLSARLEGSSAPDLKAAWEISRQVLEALEALHAKGICHGDVKPANILVDKQGRVKLTDAGLAPLAPPDAGTPSYMAPEQLAHQGGDVRTDIYQVGALVYHLVTGQPPFTGSREEVIHRAVQERPADPSTFTPKIAWQLDWVIQRALSKDPMDRFGAAREFLDGLRLGLQDSIGAPLAVPPKPAAEKMALELAPAPEKAPAPKGPAPAKAPPPEKKALELAPAAEKAPAPEKGPAPAKAATPVKAPAAEKPPAKPAEAAAKPAPNAAALAQKAKLITAPAPAAAKEPAKARMRVLFVDDDERVLNALRALFRAEYDVVLAGNAGEALALLRGEPDIPIVVSDQRMPGTTGVEFLREVRKSHPRTIRLLLTGYSDLAAMVGSINEGEVFRFVKKPWDNEEIRATLAEAAALSARLAAPPEPRKSAPAEGSILVIDPQQGLARGLEKLVAGKAGVKLVSTVPEAARLLQSGEFAAILADQKVGAAELVKLFRVVKAKRPETLSILVADEADSDLVASLINEAQIYRFLTRPINAVDLRNHVAEALRHYAAHRTGSGAGDPGPRPSLVPQA